jgi:hypothetical protein
VLSRLAIALVIGGLVGASLTYVALRNRPSWQEQQARWEASTFACTVASIGLNARCARIASFRSTSRWSYEVRYTLRGQTACFTFHTLQPPRRHACAS